MKTLLRDFYQALVYARTKKKDLWVIACARGHGHDNSTKEFLIKNVQTREVSHCL